METSDEKKSAEPKSKNQWFEVAVILLIAAVILISGAWLWKMSDVLKSPPGHVEVRHVYANFESETKRDKNEETQYTLYKQAEETLRGQMNTWLTIVGFFGVLFGLIVPLASYLLQRRSLSEEREQIKEQINKAAEEAAEKAAKKATTDTAKAIKDEIQQQIDDIRADLKKVEGIRDEIEEMRGMVEDDRKVIEQVRQTAQQATEKLDAVKGETVKTSQEIRSLAEVVAKGDGKKDTPESEFGKIKQKAEQGDAEAQVSLGYRYERGIGVKKDEFEAVYWYRKSANQGFALAQYNLGVMYAAGRGVDKNDTKAIYWYRKAAEQGYMAAQYNMGEAYDFGSGVDKDDTKAFLWYRKAAEQGYAAAQYSLGLAYRFGYGVDKDDKEAVYWYRKAAEQEYAAAENNLGFMIEHGFGCEKNGQEALDWFRKSAEHGDAMGRKNLGDIYEKGKFGVEVDFVKAKKLYQQVIDDPNAGEKPKKLAQEGLDRIDKMEAEK